MKLVQKVKKLVVPDYFDRPRELMLKMKDNCTCPELTFSKGTRFTLVRTVEDGYMDGRGELHILSHQPFGELIYRGSLKKAFTIEE